MAGDTVELRDHLRALSKFSLDKISNDVIEESVEGLEEGIAEAKEGDTAWLVVDIMQAVRILSGLEQCGKLDKEKAYPVLVAFIKYFFEKVPNIRVEVLEVLVHYPEIHKQLVH